MSVPAYKRKMSSTQFLNSLMQLCTFCGFLTIHMPHKYRYAYLDKMNNLASDALTHATIANKVYLSDNSVENDYMFRRNNFLLAKGEVHALVAIAFILFNLYEGSTDNVKHKTVMYYRKVIGELSSKAIASLDGVIKYDKQSFNKRMKKIKENEDKRRELELYKEMNRIENMIPGPPIPSATTINMNTLPLHLKPNNIKLVEMVTIVNK